MCGPDVVLKEPCVLYSSAGMLALFVVLFAVGIQFNDQRISVVCIYLSGILVFCFFQHLMTCFLFILDSRLFCPMLDLLNHFPSYHLTFLPLVFACRFFYRAVLWRYTNVNVYTCFKV